MPQGIVTVFNIGHSLLPYSVNCCTTESCGTYLDNSTLFHNSCSHVVYDASRLFGVLPIFATRLTDTPYLVVVVFLRPFGIHLVFICSLDWCVV